MISLSQPNAVSIIYNINYAWHEVNRDTNTPSLNMGQGAGIPTIQLEFKINEVSL